MTKKSIKSKMLEYCYLRHIQAKELASNIGAAPTNFAKSAIDQDISGRFIVMFLRKYHEVSPDWLLLDEGKMLRSDSENRDESHIDELLIQSSETDSQNRIWRELVDSKNQIIAIQAEQLAELRVRLAKIEGVGQ